MTLISKNVHIDKLDDIINEYNNTYQSKIKVTRVDIKSSTYTHFNVKKKLIRILNLKLMTIKI